MCDISQEWKFSDLTARVLQEVEFIFLFSLEKGMFFNGLGGLDKTGWNVKFGPYYIIIIIFINKLVS